MDAGTVQAQLARVVLGPDALEEEVLERLNGATQQSEGWLRNQLMAVRQAAVEATVLMVQGPAASQALVEGVDHEVWGNGKPPAGFEEERIAAAAQYLDVFRTACQGREVQVDPVGEAFAGRCGQAGDEAFALAGSAVFSAALAQAAEVLTEAVTSRCRV